MIADYSLVLMVVRLLRMLRMIVLMFAVISFVHMLMSMSVIVRVAVLQVAVLMLVVVGMGMLVLVLHTPLLSPMILPASRVCSPESQRASAKRCNPIHLFLRSQEHADNRRPCRICWSFGSPPDGQLQRQPLHPD